MCASFKRGYLFSLLVATHHTYTYSQITFYKFVKWLILMHKSIYSSTNKPATICRCLYFAKVFTTSQIPFEN